MGFCSALNCSNSSTKGCRMARIPKNEERRRRWIINMRRKNWQPKRHADLCLDHFDESQFEQNRQDGWKRLKQNAVPTLFNFTDCSTSEEENFEVRKFEQSTPDDIAHFPPKLHHVKITEIKSLKPDPDPLPESHLKVSEEENDEESTEKLRKRISVLERENEALRSALKEKDRVLASFLWEEQIACLYIGKLSLDHWSNEAILRALKLKSVLGRRGYMFLHKTGYPLPAISTLNKRVKKSKIDLLDTDTDVFDSYKDLLDVDKDLSDNDNNSESLMDTDKY